MADELYLNLWFPSFEASQMLSRLQSVLRQFPFSQSQPGVGYVAVHPIDWNEPALLEETFDFRTDVSHAIALFATYVHSDYAYEIEATWDLWTPVQEGDLDETWMLQPQPVRFIAHGTDFSDQVHREQGHIQVDLGLDSPFLHEEVDYTPEVEVRVKANVQKLVNFTHAIEKNCGISGRVLWSESDENLAQKLIAKLQKVQ
jgi:hypothetical protein